MYAMCLQENASLASNQDHSAQLAQSIKNFKHLMLQSAETSAAMPTSKGEKPNKLWQQHKQQSLTFHIRAVRAVRRSMHH